MQITKQKDPTPTDDGWYRVTFHQFNKEDDSDPDYFDDWVLFENGGWDYKEYKKRCRIVKILKKEENSCK